MREPRPIRRTGDRPPLSPWHALQFLLIAAAVVIAAVVAWRLSTVLLLAFGAVLVAVLFRGLADLIARWTRLPEGWALGLSITLVALVILGFIALLGTQIRSELVNLVESVPDLMETLEDRFGLTGARDWVEERLRSFARDGMIGNIAGYSGALITGVAHVLLVIFAGIYLAANPGLYLRGLTALFPPTKRGEADEALVTTGNALRLWLLGQLAAMVLVGVLTGLGLWLIGLPSALGLAVIAGILEFVPFAGPVLAAIPAIAIGMAQSPTTGLLVLGLYTVIQQVEGNLITPLIQQRAVDLPPALTMFAILAFGVLFGPLGILLATPLAVVCYVLTKKLWIREVLDETTEVPGEEEEPEEGADP